MNATVLAICDAHDVLLEDFFGSGHGRELCAARQAAVLALAAEGIPVRSIARIIGRNHAAVWYWINPEYRERQKRKALARYHKRMREASV